MKKFNSANLPNYLTYNESEGKLTLCMKTLYNEFSEQGEHETAWGLFCDDLAKVDLQVEDCYLINRSNILQYEANNGLLSYRFDISYDKDKNVAVLGDAVACFRLDGMQAPLADVFHLMPKNADAYVGEYDFYLVEEGTETSRNFTEWKLEGLKKEISEWENS